MIERFKINLTFIICFIFSCSASLSGQENLFYGLGEWKSYFPAVDQFQLLRGEHSIITINPYRVNFFYPDDQSFTSLDRINGLSDVGISKAFYAENLNVLVVGYENGNIDIISAEGVVNLSGIKTNANILVSKEINDIVVYDRYAFLATHFGIVQIDLIDLEFTSTLFLSESVIDLAIDESQGQLWATSEEAIFQYGLGANVNFADIAFWQVWPAGLSEPISQFEWWQNHLYLLADGKLWIWNSSQNIAEVTTIPVIRPIKKLQSTQDYLVYINDFDNILRWDGTSLNQTFNPCLTDIKDVLLINEAEFYYLTNQSLGLYQGNECQNLALPGLPSHNISEMGILEGDLFVMAGGVTQIFGNLFREEGFYTNEGGEWSVVNKFSNPKLAAVDMRDIISVAVDPNQNRVLMGSFWSGLIEYQSGEMTIYDPSNSALQHSFLHPGRTRISDIFLDAEDNVWMANHFAPRPIVVWTKEGEWQSFPSPVEANIERIVVDELGYLWLDVGRFGIVVVDLGDWATDADDRHHIFLPKSGDPQLFDNEQIHELVVDKEGVVWAGTASGPVRFDCGSAALENICIGRKPIIEINDVPGILLNDENVRAMAVDAGNRMWFGTESGVYVLDRYGDALDYQFTMQNSLLPSNIINDIVIDHQSGEVYIATEGGLVSFRAEAIESEFIDRKKAVVYPNPVPPAYEGLVGIKDLAPNALVRITNLNGQLIFEDRAVGGQLAWDRRDQDGRQLRSGIYLVYATSDESLSPFTQVGKIFLLN